MAWKIYDALEKSEIKEPYKDYVKTFKTKAEAIRYAEGLAMSALIRARINDLPIDTTFVRFRVIPSKT